MALPEQTFGTIQQLLTYINTYFIPNDNKEISGIEGNNILNGLANFIISYTLNSSLGKLITEGGSVVLDNPVTIIKTNTPTSLQWPDNIQNEYYIVNTTGGSIPLSIGYSYVDQNGYVKTSIPSNFILHIMKLQNSSWMQVNNSTNESTNTVVNTYADMITSATGTKFKQFLVLDDEQKGQQNTIYQYWPANKIMWMAAVVEVNL